MRASSGRVGAGVVLMLALMPAMMLSRTALPAAPRAITAGDLALRMARAGRFALPPPADARAARQALLKAGIDLGDDLDRPVTQKLLVSLGRGLGASVTSSSPDAPMTPAAGQAFIQALTGPLGLAAAAAGEGGTTVIHASCQGRDSRSGRKGTPASPADVNATAAPCSEPIP